MAALVAVFALLLAAPVERGRDCDVCPLDCPMHAARRTSRVGCHRGEVASRPAPATDEGACAMRASCGHHGGGIVAAFHADLQPAMIAVAREPRPLTPRAPAMVALADRPAPPEPPPERSVV